MTSSDGGSRSSPPGGGEGTPLTRRRVVLWDEARTWRRPRRRGPAPPPPEEPSAPERESEAVAPFTDNDAAPCDNPPVESVESAAEGAESMYSGALGRLLSRELRGADR